VHRTNLDVAPYGAKTGENDVGHKDFAPPEHSTFCSSGAQQGVKNVNALETVFGREV